MGGVRWSVRRLQPAARQHARQRGVALEEVVVDRRGGMHQRQRDQGPEQPFMHLFGQVVQ